MRRSVVLPLALAAVAYVALGYFVDLPPYGIWPEGVGYAVRLEADRALVDVRLRYRCTSWRPRRTTVYLPFSGAPGQGAPAGLEGQVEGGTWTGWPDGVLVHLSLPPGGVAEARFRYAQPCGQGAFRLDFPVIRGWGEVPPLEACAVEAPEGQALQFSVPVVRQGTADGRVAYDLAGRADQALEVKW